MSAVVFERPTTGPFIFIRDILNSALSFKEIAATQNDNLIFLLQGLKIAVISGITIWAFYEAIKIAMGLGNSNFKDFLYESFKKLLIIALFLDYGGFITLLQEGIKGFIEYVLQAFYGHGWDGFTLIQFYADTSVSLIIKIFDSASGLTDKILGAFVCVCCLFATLVGAISLLMTFLSLSVSLSLLLFIAPVAILSLVLNSTKESFTQYLKLVLNNFVSNLLVTIVAAGLIEKMVILLEAKNFDSKSMFMAAIACTVAGFMLKSGTELAMGLAEKLTVVGLEKESRSAMGDPVKTTASTVKTAAATWGAAKGFTGGAAGTAATVYRAYKGAKNTIENGADWAGNKIGGVFQKGGGHLAKAAQNWRSGGGGKSGGGANSSGRGANSGASGGVSGGGAGGASGAGGGKSGGSSGSASGSSQGSSK